MQHTPVGIEMRIAQSLQMDAKRLANPERKKGPSHWGFIHVRNTSLFGGSHFVAFTSFCCFSKVLYTSLRIRESSILAHKPKQRVSVLFNVHADDRCWRISLREDLNVLGLEIGARCGVAALHDDALGTIDCLADTKIIPAGCAAAGAVAGLSGIDAAGDVDPRA